MSDSDQLRAVFDRYALMALPYVLFFSALVVNIALPLQIGGQSAHIPLVFMTLYFWTIYRPTLVPVWLTFIAGLCLDIFSAGALGVNALGFLIMRGLILNQRRFLLGQGFMPVWLIFALVTAAFMLFRWAVFSAVNWTLFSLMTIGPPLFTGVIAFPVVFLILAQIEKILPPVKKSRM